MALCGIFVRGLRTEFQSLLENTRLTKIQQPEGNEVLLTLKNATGEYRIMLSVSAENPSVYRTFEKKESPITAPNFLMVLRKHLGNARFLQVSQPSLERILFFDFEHADEMGDLKRKRLCIEMMGKHSNIILLNDSDEIIDAIKHVSPLMSSLRTVLPGKPYFIPNTAGKSDPLTASDADFSANLVKDVSILENFTKYYTGFAYETVSEWLLRNGLHPDDPVTGDNMASVTAAFSALRETLLSDSFRFTAVFREKKPIAFSALPFVSYTEDAGFTTVPYDSPSELLTVFYSAKQKNDAMKSRSADLRKNLKNLIEREAKKRDLYEKQLRDTESRETNKLYGDLLLTYQYSLPVGESPVTVQNYYDENKELRIPVDKDLSIRDNANRYYAKYNKQKRTFAALTDLLKESEEKLYHLRSVLTSVEFAETEGDLLEIRREMTAEGYLRSTPGKKGPKRTVSEPYHFVSSDGFHMYVGKNNSQNDELTFKKAKGNDFFFHAKKAPGSHVILVTDGREVPERTYEEAASLAAHFSSVSEARKVEVDYVEKKQVKKPAGAKPGFVVYYTNYSMMADTDISGIQKLS